MSKMEKTPSDGSFRSIAKHSAIYTAAGFLNKGIGFLMIPLYTHYLTPADYGIIEVLALVLEVISMLIGVRILSAETRYYHYYDDYKDKREVFTTTLIFTVSISVAAALLLAAGAPLLARFALGSESFAPHVLLIILCLAIQNIYLVGENDLIVRKKSLFYSGMSTGLMTLGLTLNILLLSVYKMGVWAILFSMLVVKIVNLAVIPVTLRGDPLRFSWSKLKPMIRYGLPLVPAALAMFSIHYSDRLFIQKYCSLTEVGIYSLGYKFGMMISMLIATPFQRAWQTHSFEIAKNHDAKSIYSRVFTYFTCLLVLAALGVSVFIDDAITVLSPDSYAGAAALVPILVLAYVFMGMSNFVTLGILLSFQTQKIGLYQVPLALVNVLLNIALIQSFGMMGAAYSTLITFALMFFVTLYASQRLFFIPYEYRRLSMLFLTTFALFAASRLFAGSWLPQLLYHCVVFSLFPALLIVFRFFEKDEVASGRLYLRKMAHWLSIAK